MPHLNSGNPAEKSAALMALSLLMHIRRSDGALGSEITKMLPNVASLLRDAIGGISTPEQVRAVLTFLKVATQILSPDNLQLCLPSILSAITRGLGKDEQGKYPTYCRAIIRKLLKKVDKDQIRALIPEAEQSLLNHVLRMSRRSERKKMADAKKDVMEEMLNKSDDESDDDAVTDASGRGTGGGRPAVNTRPKATFVKDFNLELSENILGDGVGEILAAATSGVSNRAAASAAAESEDEDYELGENEHGILTFKEKGGRKVSNKRGRDDAEPELEEKKDEPEPQGLNQGVSFNGPRDRKAAPERKRAAPGVEYRSKKAGGDVWKKGMMEPHAFIPLDPKLLITKKGRDRGMAVMTQVVSASQQGGGGAPRSSANSAKPVRGQIMNKKQRESLKRHGK